MTDRVKETPRIVKAGAGEPVEPPPETTSVADEPDPDDNDAELDIAALLCGVTAKLDALADYVAGLEADGRRGVFYDHKDAVNGVALSLRKTIRMLNAVDKSPQDPRATKNADPRPR